MADQPNETNHERSWIVGVDIGGTKLSVGVVPAEGGTPRALTSEATRPERGGVDVVDRVCAMIRGSVTRLIEEEGVREGNIVGIGIGSPGPLNRQSGVVINTPNLGWQDFPLRDLIVERTGMSAVLDNDANCAIYGEWWQGAGRGFRKLVGVTIGTGIGGGIVIDGEIFHGASDAAGEIGHMTVNFAGRKCKCGNYGCLEAYASGPNIAARAVEGLEAGSRSLLTDLVDGDLARITAATVYEAVVLGDAHANEVMSDTAKLLAVGVANLINLLNPEAVVIGGGVTLAGPHLLDPLAAEVRRRAFRSASDACAILPGELPDTAGVIGAAGIFGRYSQLAARRHASGGPATSGRSARETAT